jgi:3-hydroxybutyryl-CoA dehydratase
MGMVPMAPRLNQTLRRFNMETTTLEKFAVGQTCVYEQVIDDPLVHAFAEMSGDRNVIHLDDAVAKTSRFGQRIAHGGILFAIVSKVLGMDMPGVGTVYLSQTCNFKLPVFIGDKIKLVATITDLKPKSIAVISTIITKQTGEVVMDGFAEVKLPGWLFKA